MALLFSFLIFFSCLWSIVWIKCKTVTIQKEKNCSFKKNVYILVSVLIPFLSNPFLEKSA